MQAIVYQLWRGESRVDKSHDLGVEIHEQGDLRENGEQVCKEKVSEKSKTVKTKGMISGRREKHKGTKIQCITNYGQTRGKHNKNFHLALKH